MARVIAGERPVGIAGRGTELRAVVQRVSSARVVVGGDVVGEIGPGLCVLLDVADTDDAATAERLAGRVARLRIFENDECKFDRSLVDVGDAALVVSQFTLIADTEKGNRPSFSHAARPEVAALRAILRGAAGARRPGRDRRLRRADAGRAGERRPGHDRARLAAEGGIPRSFAILDRPHFSCFEMGAPAPIRFEGDMFVQEEIVSTSVYGKERSLLKEVGPRVERGVPGIEVLALELLGRERFRVYVDHPDGVTHALCERVTNVLRDYLDRYTVEVSSPGLDRPLRTPSHFERAVGRRVALRTEGEFGGRTRFRGELLEAGPRMLKIAAAGAEPVDIPYEAIVRGNLIDEG